MKRRKGKGGKESKGITPFSSFSKKKILQKIKNNFGNIKNTLIFVLLCQNQDKNQAAYNIKPPKT